MGHPQGKKTATKHRTIQRGTRGVQSLHNNFSKGPNIHFHLYYHIPVHPHMKYSGGMYLNVFGLLLVSRVGSICAVFGLHDIINIICMTIQGRGKTAQLGNTARRQGAPSHKLRDVVAPLFLMPIE